MISSSGRRLGWQVLARLLGLLLFVWISLQLDWEEAGQSIRSLSIGYLAIYVLLFSFMMFIRVQRMKAALLAMGHNLTYGRLYHVIVESSFLGAVTPGRVGEMIKVAFLKDSGLTFSEGLVFALLERGYDFLFLLIIGAVGAAYFVYRYANPEYTYLLIGILPIGAAVFAVSVRYLLGKKLGVPHWVARRMPSFVLRHGQEMRADLSRIFMPTLPSIAAYTLALSLINVGQVYFLAKAFAMDIGVLDIGFAYATATIIALLPISISGLGTREASYIFLLGQSGVTPEAALLFSLFDGVLFAYAALFVMAAPLWMKKPLPQARTK